MTLNTVMSRGWTAAVAAAILATVAALALVGYARAQSVDDLTVGSATVAPGDEVTLNVTATVDDLGSYGINITYDTSLVSVTGCTSTNGQCNPEFDVGTIRMNGSSSAGIDGDDVLLGTITFQAGDTEGVADVEVDTDNLTLSDSVGETLTVTPTNGAITIATPTASPTPAPTDEPTATPGALPDTGGAPADGSASTIAWLLAATGLVVVAGGAWAFARARREN